MRVSIVIPCFNEKLGIEQLKQRLIPCLDSLRQKYSIEVLFIDDGSRDNTAEQIEKIFGELEDKKIICHETNLGVGAALKTGFHAANGDIICSIDSDCTYDPMDLVSMIPLIGDNADMVTGSPYHPEGAVEGVPEGRLFLSRNLSVLYNVIFGLQVYTYTSILRAYKRAIVKSLKFEADGFVISAEILVKSLLAGYRLAEFPTVLRARKYGRSKIKILKVIGEHLYFMSRAKVLLLLGRVRFSGGKQ